MWGGWQLLHNYFRWSSHIFISHSEPLQQNIRINYGNSFHRVTVSSVKEAQCERSTYKLANNRNLQLLKMAENLCTVLYYVYIISYAHYQDGNKVQTSDRWTLISFKAGEAMLTLYNTFVLSHQDYFSQLWSPYSAKLTAEFEVVY